MSIKNIFFIMLLGVGFCSCLPKRKAFVYDLSEGLDKSRPYFILKDDSTTLPCKDIKLNLTTVFGKLTEKSTITVDDTLKISAKEVLGFQANGGYHTWSSDYKGYIPRLIFGPISKYTGRTLQVSTSTNNAGGVRSSTSYSYTSYLQKGDGSLISYNVKNLYSLVSDYAPAMEILDDYFFREKQTRKRRRINNIIAFGGLGLSMLGAGSDSEPMMYGGLGVFTTGVVLGFRNRKMSEGNDELVDMALIEYNKPRKKRK
jgi:hypothetical protein